MHVVYDEGYNVSSLGSVGTRYGAIFSELKGRLSDSLQISSPLSENIGAIYKSHTPEYMESLSNPTTIRGIFEMKGGYEEADADAETETDTEIENPCVSDADIAAICHSQQLQFAGSLTTVQLALTHGFAVNLGGGLHHASRNAGSGFCIYNDITACVDWLLETGRATRILIVDLDAHQGNGYEEDLWPACEGGKVCIFDAYEPMIFPFPAGESVKKSIHYYIPYLREDRGDFFINQLLKGIDLPFEEFQPDFVIYNAGSDTLEEDPVTHLGQTADAIRDRDYVVVETCRRANIPVAIFLSGGYGKHVPEVVASSLEQIFLKKSC
jgi:acetoin utilization deacetylase AcuC-like enzyme